MSGYHVRVSCQGIMSGYHLSGYHVRVSCIQKNHVRVLSVRVSCQGIMYNLQKWEIVEVRLFASIKDMMGAVGKMSMYN